MKSQSPLIWIVAALLGVAGGYVGNVLQSTASPTPIRSLNVAEASSAKVSPLGDAHLAKLERRIIELEQEGALASDRIASLERRPANDGRNELAPAALDEGQLANLEEEMRMLERLNNPEAPLPEYFRARVAEAINLEREAEERERDEKRRTQREERMEERLTELATKIGMNVYQKDEMRNILLGQEEKRGALFADARESGDFRSMRDTMRTLRDETNLAIGQVLSPDQMKQYEEQDTGRFGGSGRTRRDSGSGTGSSGNSGGGGNTGGGRGGGGRGR